MKHIMSFQLETWIKNQIQIWEESKKEIIKEDVLKPFITVSREYGCNINSTVLALSEALNTAEDVDLWQAYDKDLLQKIHEDHEVNEMLLQTIDTEKRKEMTELMRNMLTDYPPQVSAHIQLIKTIRTLAIQGRKIFVGRAGVVITRDMKQGLHLRMIAPLNYRINRVMEVQGIKDRHEAEKRVKEQDTIRHEFMTQYVKFDAHNPASYDLTINVERFSSEEIVELVVGALKARNLIK